MYFLLADRRQSSQTEIQNTSSFLLRERSQARQTEIQKYVVYEASGSQIMGELKANYGSDCETSVVNFNMWPVRMSSILQYELSQTYYIQTTRTKYVVIMEQRQVTF